MGAQGAAVQKSTDSVSSKSGHKKKKNADKNDGAEERKWWLLGEGVDPMMAPAHRYTEPLGPGPRGMFLPDINADTFTQILYSFYNMLEPDEYTVPGGPVERELVKRFAWSGVRIEYWRRFLQVIRPKDGRFTILEYFTAYMAVESGEFFSAGPPDPYEDPDRWVINEKTGAIEERLHAFESTLTSPRGGKQAAMFAQCLGMLFHQIGLDDPRVLVFRMLEAGKPVDTSFSELMCKSREWGGAGTRVRAPGIVLGPSAERSMQAVFSAESNSFKRVSNTRSAMMTMSASLGIPPASRPGTGGAMSESLFDSLRGRLGAAPPPGGGDYAFESPRPQTGQTEGSHRPHTMDSRRPGTGQTWNTVGVGPASARQHTGATRRGGTSASNLSRFTRTSVVGVGPSLARSKDHSMREITMPRPERDATPYDTDEGAIESYQSQQMADRALESREGWRGEIAKIFRHYFARPGCPQVLSHADEIPDELISIREYHGFWKSIGFYSGKYIEHSPWIFNKAYAYGIGLVKRFEDYADKSNLDGRAPTYKKKDVLMSFDQFVLSLEELGVLLFGSKGPRHKRGIRVMTEIIFPRAERKFANPVYKHFKRPDVQELVRRYKEPLRRVFDHFIGSIPTPAILGSILEKKAARALHNPDAEAAAANAVSNAAIGREPATTPARQQGSQNALARIKSQATVTFDDEAISLERRQSAASGVPQRTGSCGDSAVLSRAASGASGVPQRSGSAGGAAVVDRDPSGASSVRSKNTALDEGAASNASIGAVGIAGSGQGDENVAVGYVVGGEESTAGALSREQSWSQASVSVEDSQQGGVWDEGSAQMHGGVASVPSTMSMATNATSVVEDSRINVEELLLMCRAVDILPRLIGEEDVRFIFVRSNFGLDADDDPNLLDFQEFIECLCRIALTIYGQKILSECQGGQTGLTQRIFGQDAPRPADLLSPAQRQLFNPGAKVWGKGGPVKRLPTPKVSCGTIPNNQSTRDWIRQHPGCWKPTLPGASLKLQGSRRKEGVSESIVF